MTIREMMEILAQFDEDMEVVINDGGDEVSPNYIENHDGTVVIQYIW